MSRRFSFVSNDEAASINGGAAVVIDVVRAFTTAAWAFERGVDHIVLTDSLDEALRLKAMIPGALALKDAEPQPGFELANSPAQMRDHPDIAGRTVVQRTTHGTIGAVAARGATVMFCASFPNSSATAKAVRDSGESHVWFVVTGEEGTAPEDIACAEFIAALIEDPSAAPHSYVARVDTSSAAKRIQASADAGSSAAHVDDIRLTKEVDRFGFAMTAADEEGLLVLRRVEV